MSYEQELPTLTVVDALNDDPRFSFDRARCVRDGNRGVISIYKAELASPNTSRKSYPLLVHDRPEANERQIWLLRTDQGRLVGAKQISNPETTVAEVEDFYSLTNPTLDGGTHFIAALQKLREHHELHLDLGDQQRRSMIVNYLKIGLSKLCEAYLLGFRHGCGYLPDTRLQKD